MKAAQTYLLLHLFLTAAVQVNAFDLLSAGILVSKLWELFMANESFQLKVTEFHSRFLEEVSPFIQTASSALENQLWSCSKWISFNPEGLRTDLKNKLYGQHIASRTILNAVTGFMSDDNPKKPLVLSLHGPTGTGKNFVSQMIAENIYKEGMMSRFVNVFLSMFHFPHESQIDSYKSQLQQWIRGNVSRCERSIFIFDKMDKMHPGLIDSIKPYLDYYANLDGVSYRKAIFIFLSNTGSEEITATALHFRKEGRRRDEIKLKDLEESVSASAFNDKNGFHHSNLIDEHLVDFFVPFLPLEHGHVLRCTMAAMEAKGLTPDQDVAEQMAGDLVYFPKSERIFSAKGCKTIASRLYDYITLLSPSEVTIQ